MGRETPGTLKEGYWEDVIRKKESHIQSPKDSGSAFSLGNDNDSDSENNDNEDSEDEASKRGSAIARARRKKDKKQAEVDVHGELVGEAKHENKETNGTENKRNNEFVQKANMSTKVRTAAEVEKQSKKGSNSSEDIKKTALGFFNVQLLSASCCVAIKIRC